MNLYDDTPAPPDAEWIADKRHELLNVAARRQHGHSIMGTDPLTMELRPVVELEVDRVIDGVLGGAEDE